MAHLKKTSEEGLEENLARLVQLPSCKSKFWITATKSTAGN